MIKDHTESVRLRTNLEESSCPEKRLTEASTADVQAWMCKGKLAPGVIVVGLGGNIGGQESTVARLHSALSELSARFGQARVSSLYCSSPVGPVQSQPDFVNAVAAWKLDGEFTPEGVLAVLQEVENLHGRVRETKGGARTLDLDLLYYGSLVRDGDKLVIPHPRILSRAFVIVPLIDLCGDSFVAQGSTIPLGDIRKSPSLQSQGLRLCSLPFEPIGKQLSGS